MPFFEGKDTTLFYERTGQGEPLLFFNGTGGDLRVRPNMLDGPLAKNFDLLVHDQRGLGQSSVPEGPYTMADYADDGARLLDHIGWESCLVVGVSFGGMVGQEFALRHPGRTKRLVLACTSGGGRGGASYPLHELQGMEPRERARKMLAISDKRLDAKWQAENQEKVEDILDGILAQRAHIPPTDQSLRGAVMQLEARAGHDTWDRLAEIDVPTFLCGGKYDGLAPASNLEALNSVISNSTIKFYEGGHMFLVQDRQALKDITAFLKEEPVQ